MSDDRHDLELIQEFLSGSTAAFDVLYERYRQTLYAYINNLLRNNYSQADDIFQQTWIRAISKLSSYRNQEKFSAWLMRIAHNLVIDEYRASTRRSEEAFDNSLEDTLPEQNPEKPWQNMDQDSLAQAVSAALEQLSPELREVFILRRKQVPFKEIAEIQQCSLNTCLARMQYAVKQMKKLLKDWDSLPSDPR